MADYATLELIYNFFRFFMIFVYIFLGLITVGIILGYIFLYIIDSKISRFEKKCITLFLSRSDTIPALFEITKDILLRHGEIFGEIVVLRKQEFSLREVSLNIENFIELEKHIHHEINFIFQVCNKNRELLSKKEFLYTRDIIMQRSLLISKNLKKYKELSVWYNTLIRKKNYTLIGYILPFTKRSII